jgi:hypothetical protein
LLTKYAAAAAVQMTARLSATTVMAAAMAAVLAASAAARQLGSAMSANTVSGYINHTAQQLLWLAIYCFFLEQPRLCFATECNCLCTHTLVQYMCFSAISATR